MKFMRYKKDGFVVAYDKNLEGNSEFEVIDVPDGEDPVPAEFRAPVYEAPVPSDDDLRLVAEKAAAEAAAEAERVAAEEASKAKAKK